MGLLTGNTTEISGALKGLHLILKVYNVQIAKISELGNERNICVVNGRSFLSKSFPWK